MSVETDLQPDFIKYWLALKRHWLPAMLVFGSTVGLTTVYTLLKTPVYRVQGQVIYEQDKSGDLLGLSSTAQNLGLSGSDGDRAIASELRVILSEPVLQKTLEAMKTSVPAGTLPGIEGLKNTLVVKNAASTNIIQISYDSTDPKVAASIVDKLMQVYQQSNVQTTRGASIAARQFITAQLPEVRRNVYRADLALRQFKEDQKISSLEVATKSNAENLVRVEEQIDQTQTQLTSASSDLRNLQQKLGLDAEEALSVSSVGQSLAVQGSLADVQELRRKLADARSQFQESHPSVVSLKAKLNEAEALLKSQVAKSLEGKGVPKTSRLQVGATQQDLLNTLIKTQVSQVGLTNQLATLSQQQSKYLDKSKQLPALEQHLRELERELLVAEGTYQALLKSLQEVRVSENRTIGNVKIIEPSQIQAVPVAPNKQASISAGALAGILMAVALVYLLETTNTHLKRAEEIQQLYGYPLLGTIPKFTFTPNDAELSQLPVIKAPKSALSESYRMIQANIKFLSSDNPSRVIAVSSSVPQEGKSTTCANLAAALHQMGNKVVVVDLDLHRPTQHKIWQLSNAVGISDFLADQTDGILSITQVIEKGLNVITSGTLPPNPLGLIDSQRMMDAIHTWSEHYDFVIIDTPPVNVAADAAVLGKLSHGLVMVARPDVLEKSKARFSRDYLNQLGIRVPGLIINGVIPENETNGYYYYSQYSNYSEDIRPKKKLDTEKLKSEA